MARLKKECLSADQNMPNLSNMAYHDAIPRRLHIQGLPSTPPLMPLNCYGGMPSVMAADEAGVATAGELQEMILKLALGRMGWLRVQQLGFLAVQRQIFASQPAARFHIQNRIRQRHIFADTDGRLISAVRAPSLDVAMCIDAKHTLMYAVDCSARGRRACGGRCQFCYQDAVDHVYRFTHSSLSQSARSSIMAAIGHYNTFSIRSEVQLACLATRRVSAVTDSAL